MADPRIPNPIPYQTQDAVKLKTQTGPRVDTGYAVNLPNVDPNTKDNWTIRLIKPNNKYLNLWVEDASIDFSMHGSTGQSRWKREFYPHSFNQPVLKLMGRMPNQREYNKLAAFVRESHAEALRVNKNLTEKTNAGVKSYAGTRIPLPTVTLIMNPRYYYNDRAIDAKRSPRNQKGGRKGMELEGYIKSIAAGSKKFEFAPQFEIQFIIASSKGSVGIYDDKLRAGSKITDWMTLFKDGQFGAKSGSSYRADELAKDRREREAERAQVEAAKSLTNLAEDIIAQSGIDQILPFNLKGG